MPSGKVQQYKEGSELNGTYHYANDVNTMSENRDTEALLGASKEVALEVNTEKTKYMAVSHHHNVGQTIYSQLTNPMKMWQSSHIWEQ
jgi:hypothetical protein